MATNKKAVMVYLPEDLETFVSDYCLENDITIDKDGDVNPRMGTGIVRLLESLVKGKSATSGKSLSPDSQKVKEIEIAIASCNERFGHLESVVEQLKNSPEPGLTKDEIQGMIDESIKAAIAVEAETLYQLLAEQAKQAQLATLKQNQTETVSEKFHEREDSLPPETVTTIAVEPETVNDPEPEPVGETWLEPGTYQKKYLGELFGLKDTQSLKKWLSGEMKTTQSKVIPFCNPEWWEIDNKGNYTYSGPRKLIGEQTQPTPPIESKPTVEAVEAEPEKK